MIFGRARHWNEVAFVNDMLAAACHSESDEK
jgi:hypothetical protein